MMSDIGSEEHPIKVFFVPSVDAQVIVSGGEIMADAVTGTMERFDLFAGLKHLRTPGPRWLGNQVVALGMLYYRLKDKL